MKGEVKVKVWPSQPVFYTGSVSINSVVPAQPDSSSLHPLTRVIISPIHMHDPVQKKVLACEYINLFMLSEVQLSPCSQPAPENMCDMCSPWKTKACLFQPAKNKRPLSRLISVPGLNESKPSNTQDWDLHLDETLRATQTQKRQSQHLR